MWGHPTYHVNVIKSNERLYGQASYRRIPKISPGAYISQRPILMGLSTKGNLRFKIDWASLIAGNKSTILALFYYIFEGNFPSTSPQGAYIWRGDLTEGFLRYRFEGLIFGGAYFRNFTVPHLKGLPHLLRVPHLHVNRPLPSLKVPKLSACTCLPLLSLKNVN